jgi:hypothetical protein
MDMGYYFFLMAANFKVSSFLERLMGQEHLSRKMGS